MKTSMGARAAGGQAVAEWNSGWPTEENLMPAMFGWVTTMLSRL
jgi:hypothetical protein